MKLIKSLLLGAAFIVAISSAAFAATEMRCSHQLPPKHHIAKVIDRWAEEVKKESGGDLDVQIFGANSLVGARENITSTAKGDIECAFSVNFQWGKTLPIMNVTVAPFAFGDIDNDGDQDCFAGLDVPLAGLTHQVLLNDGNGRFEKVPSSGLEGVASFVANAVFAANNQFTFQLLSDCGGVAIKAYDAEFPDFAGIPGYTVAKRAVYVVDSEGILRYRWVAPNPGVEPDYEEVKSFVREL